MRGRFLSTVLLPIAALGVATTGQAQSGAVGLLPIGTAAPDFVLPGATRFGILREPVRLSDYRGKTVVLSFFYRARTPG